MKIKLALIAAVMLAGAVFGTTQLQADAAEPGKVGNAPRCEVSTGKARDNSFVIKDDVARVEFKATGPENCKVQLSNNSFYAPSMNGRPWSKQILFERETKVFGRGTHSLSVAVPTKSTPAKGCFYQIDLTYGERNVLPVHAYAHGKIKDCGEQPPKPDKPEPKPQASCTGLGVQRLTASTFRLTGTADVKNGAKVKAYEFSVYQNGKRIWAVPVRTDAKTARIVYIAKAPGTYTAQVNVVTTIGDRFNSNCKANFTVTPPAPGDIEVCVIATKELKTIKETEFNSAIHTKDLTKCAETPENPETPSELPNTGAGAIVAIFTGVSTLAGAAHWAFVRRFM